MLPTCVETRLRDLHPETREGPVQPSSYRPISLLDMVGNLFDKHILARILIEVSGRMVLRDDQFGFRPKHSTALQLARLVECPRTLARTG